MAFGQTQKKLVITIIYLAILLIAVRIVFKYLVDFNLVIAFLSDNYRNYGPIILLLSGLIEGIVVIGLYFPGSTIILLGATLAGISVLPLWSVILWTTLGLTFAYIINFQLGLKGGKKFLEKVGFSRSSKLRSHIEKSNIAYLWITFHPNIAAFAAVVMGVLRVDAKKALFGLILGQIFWSTFWGLIFYYFGMYIFNRIAFFAIIFIAAGLIWEIFRFVSHPKKVN